ncbi:MAG: Gfo/Idh/MocA family oxidoreductase [Proteobacteria bacterium]|nr:Gfo/Idh/MocA family oxidoreductase [Pseudomonadota bacterium]MBU1714061.1 Gfo/Idh/MocA family oxidoreductase [Pseudomonadota bacterium]
MKEIKVGVIGVGYLGKFHAAKYAAMDGVILAGVADVSSVVASEIAARHGTRAYTDFNELIEVVDAVSVVVPTSNHFEVAAACLGKGVDVLIEKPMTSSLEQADKLIAMADDRKLILQTGLLEQFNPAVLAMEEHITRPMFIESHRIHVFKSRGVDVDVVLDLMIHDIDIILSIVDSPIKTIHAVGAPVVTSATDIANARLIFENGCTANVTVSRISRDNLRRVRIFQPRSFVSVDYGKKELTVIRQLDELGEDGQPKQDVIQACYMEKDALEAELRDFVENVRSRTRPRVSGREGRRALAVAIEIIAQIKEHAATHCDLLKV